MKDVTGYLQTKQQAAIDEEVGAEWAKLEEIYTKKLWHQLTQKLLEFIHHPIFNEGDELITIYKNFISDFEHRINPLSLMEIALCVSKQIESYEESLKYLESIKEKVKNSKEAVVLCLTTSGLLHLKEGILDKCKSVISEAEQTLDSIDGVTVVHGRFYQLAAAYHQRQGDHAEFYKNTLRYLGCVSMDTIPDEEKVAQAVALSLAALLGKGVYNFGELLAHPILDTLLRGEHQWLVDTLYAFNSGNIAKWEELKPHWSKLDALTSQEAALRQKLMLLALMEMTFRRSGGGSGGGRGPGMAAHSRQLTFGEVAAETRLPEAEVELLVMKALSLGLVRGQIDEVERKVLMTWVQPRVLDKQQIQSMQDRLTDWSASVKQMEILLESNAHDILDKMYH